MILATRSLFFIFRNTKTFSSVLSGAHGPTAQFWTTYIYFINRLHREVQRCVKVNDVDGYIEIFPKMLETFFSLNRPNYARWGMLFLEKLRCSSPEMTAMLKKGAFSIRRNKKNYSRSAIDITLEQTVNHDAPSSSRGRVAFQNSESAIRRWSVTTSQRAMAITELKAIMGIGM